jgi:hypothetical protein
MRLPRLQVERGADEWCPGLALQGVEVEARARIPFDPRVVARRRGRAELDLDPRGAGLGSGRHGEQQGCAREDDGSDHEAAFPERWPLRNGFPARHNPTRAAGLAGSAIRFYSGTSNEERPTRCPT